MEGCVDLGGWLHAEMVYLSAVQTVAHPGTNRAQHRVTSLIVTNAHHSLQPTEVPADVIYVIINNHILLNRHLDTTVRCHKTASQKCINVWNILLPKLHYAR